MLTSYVMGTPVDQKKMSLIQAHVRIGLKKRLEATAKRDGLSTADVVRLILYRWQEDELEREALSLRKRETG